MHPKLRAWAPCFEHSCHACSFVMFKRYLDDSLVLVDSASLELPSQPSIIGRASRDMSCVLLSTLLERFTHLQSYILPKHLCQGLYCDEPARLFLGTEGLLKAFLRRRRTRRSASATLTRLEVWQMAFYSHQMLSRTYLQRGNIQRTQETDRLPMRAADVRLHFMGEPVAPSRSKQTLNQSGGYQNS